MNFKNLVKGITWNIYRGNPLKNILSDGNFNMILQKEIVFIVDNFCQSVFVKEKYNQKLHAQLKSVHMFKTESSSF